MVTGNAVKETLGTVGPISICVDASNWASYKSGVFSNCGGSNLNHAVVAVGYEENGVWIVRNSWGASWGDQGHIRLAPGNTCGLQNHVVVPNLA
jgi:C1A family cysteine protease